MSENEQWSKKAPDSAGWWWRITTNTRPDTVFIYEGPAYNPGLFYDSEYYRNIPVEETKWDYWVKAVDPPPFGKQSKN